MHMFAVRSLTMMFAIDIPRLRVSMRPMLSSQMEVCEIVCSALYLTYQRASVPTSLYLLFLSQS
jgi:hypothetical protein